MLEITLFAHSVGELFKQTTYWLSYHQHSLEQRLSELIFFRDLSNNNLMSRHQGSKHRVSSEVFINESIESILKVFKTFLLT